MLVSQKKAKWFLWHPYVLYIDAAQVFLAVDAGKIGSNPEFGNLIYSCFVLFNFFCRILVHLFHQGLDVSMNSCA